MRRSPILLCSLILAGAAVAAETPASDTPEQVSENYCHDRAIWDRIEALRRQFPNDSAVIRSYALRLGLCRLIDEGKITLEQGVEIFDIEKRRVMMERAAEDARKKAPKSIPLEDLEPRG